MAGRIDVEGGILVFELSGLDEFFAIKRSITVPLEHVVSVSTGRVPWKPLRGLKLGGTSFPGVIKDGRFLDPDGRVMFFEMHDPDRCVTVNLDHEKYKSIVFEVPDKHQAAKIITDAMNSGECPARATLPRCAAARACSAY